MYRPFHLTPELLLLLEPVQPGQVGKPSQSGESSLLKRLMELAGWRNESARPCVERSADEAVKACGDTRMH